jgi:hypothetical protein
MTPALILRPHGRLGNHLLQWVTAQSLAARVPGLQVHNFDLGPLGLRAGGFARRQPFVPRLTEQDSDLALAARLMSDGEMPLARLWCMVLQVSAWEPPARLRALLPAGPAGVQTAGPDEILLNVRADEILKARHRDYGPLGLGFYAAVLRETGLKPVFMGQLGDDPYSQLLRTSFPGARFLPSQGVAGDFQAMRQARHLALSVSTFSWAAGWLSEAESLHMPLTGFYHPSQRPDIDLCPVEDARFRFYDCGPRLWQATPEQIAALQDLTPVKVLTAAEVEALRRQACQTRAAARQADAARLIAAARRTRPFAPILAKVYAKP